ncbi:LysR family transcriptional regulator [Salmonella enterica]|uniref:LysR substrate-binding domain-containing protein n=1 Tax=Salmonella enterica TaxID=28901 RepID=UPI001013AC78|nr:LysR substrate-binding domain-containing protein [Salmonella enterica]ECC3255610.1 LysR family transcriptional regulator [Salmonella enterica subsp. enterica]ECG5957679.1 LysR family transcriptional regulator [Salmonella enterica subsp. enterica serovar Baguida]EDU6361979.1 LysR family transcriptional regulator [Salmonella enterica subsp. enterica serovar Florian]EDW2625536.1 LysR family transcriptional regulator [Salmonella enterica subsp. enterica serovar Sangalkam]EAS1757639.1 LysR famil
MNQPLQNKSLPVPSLRNIQAFIEVADTNSLNLAAENLNVTASAVSHQIASLEQYLGKKLFSRSSKGVVLTAIGEKYLKEVSGALNIIGQATNQVINDIHQDYLRIHSAPSFGLLWLMPRLNKFRQARPELKISLTCSYESIQFSRDNIDIDIRHGLSQWPTLVVKTIKNERMLPYTSSTYLASHSIQNIEDLLGCDLIHSDSTLINWSNWLSWHKVRGWNKNFIFNFDRSYMSIEAARMGMGIILESNLLAGQSVSQRHLAPVFTTDVSMPVNAHHFVLPHHNEQKEKVRIFFNWVSKELSREGFQI